MATKVSRKTTFEASRSIQPIYTGGDVSANESGSLLATAVEEDILVINIKTGTPLVRIEGDGEPVTSICLSPKADYLVVCSRSMSMTIYSLRSNDDLLTAELVRTLKPHSSPVISTEFDLTGSILATGSADGIVKVWDVRGGYCSHTFHGHGGVVTALLLFDSIITSLQVESSNNRKRKISNGENTSQSKAGNSSTLLLASGGEDGKIKIWDLNSRKVVATLDSHVSVVRSLDYCSQKQSLLSAGRDKTIVLWDTSRWAVQKIIPALEVLESAGFLNNGDLCYAGGENGRTRIWSTSNAKEITKEQQPGLETEAIVSIVKVADENALLTVHQDQMMDLRSCAPLHQVSAGSLIEPLPVLRRVSGNHDEIIDMACIGPDRSILALANNTESIKLISIGSQKDKSAAFGSDLALLEGHTDVVICMDVDWSGHWLATGAKDNNARLWRLDPASSTYECFATFSGHAESIGAIALPRGPPAGGSAAKDALGKAPSYLITGSQDKTVKRWDTSKLSLPTKEPHAVAKAAYTRVAHEKDINALDVSPTGALFASASQDRTIKVWSIDDGSVTGILRGHKRGVWSIRFSPANAPPLNLAEGGTSSSRGLIVSGSGDRTVKIWSLSTYTCLLTFEGHSNSVLKVIWLPPPPIPESEHRNQQQQNQTQPMIASASSDTLVKIWSPYAPGDSDHLLATLDNHTDRVWSLTSPLQSSFLSKTDERSSPRVTNSYSLISGAADASLTFWTDTTVTTAETTSKQMTERIEQDQLLQNHIHARNYREVITLSLALNHPGRLLRVFEDVVNLPDTEKEADSLMGVKAVDDVLVSLSQEETYKLLERVRDWNTNARTSPVAPKVLNCLLRKRPQSSWLDMAKNRSVLKLARSGKGGGGGLKDLFRALEVYTDKHYKRMEELTDESYLIEYTLREMDEIAGTIATVNVGDDVSLQEDIIMV